MKRFPLLFFVLVYANQGMSGLPEQCLYYLQRETLMLSAGTIGLISFITGLSWYVKPLWGFLIDYVNIQKYRSKYYLIFSYIGLILCTFYIICFGLNIISLIVLGLIMNCFIGICDVANDTQMCVFEKKYKLQGKVQAIQWTSLGVAGLVVSILGAYLADKFDETINYRIAYSLTLIIPIITLVYLFLFYKEDRVKKNKKIDGLWKDLKKGFTKEFVLCLAFIACFQMCPSFGTALMIKCRESLGVDKMFLGYLGATGGVLGIAGYLLYYWKFHKINIEKLLYFMIVFSAITNLFYLYIPNKWYLVGYNLAFGVFSGITFLTLLAFFARIVPKNSEGMMYAFVTSISNLCGRGGSWAGGVIYDHWGYNMTVIVSTVTTVLCLFFIPLLFKK
jgi:MFS family permease